MDGQYIWRRKNAGFLAILCFPVTVFLRNNYIGQKSKVVVMGAYRSRALVQHPGCRGRRITGQ